MEFQRKPYYSPAEVAEIVGLNTETVLRHIRSGVLPAARLTARTYRVPYGALMQWLMPETAPVVRKLKGKAEPRPRRRQLATASR
jgi:excisionase family DNA binding protein